LRGMSYRYSWTDPIKGLSGVFGTHPLNAISLLFVLEKIEALIPGKHLAAPSFPYPRKVNFLLADTKTTRRSCSSVGIRPLEIAAPVLFGLLVIRRTLFKRNPICGFEDDRLCGRAGPTSGVSMSFMMKNDRVYWHRHYMLCLHGSWTLLEGSSSSTRCKPYSSRTPAMRGRSRGSGGRIVRPLLLFGLLRVHVRRYYRVLLPLRVGTFEFQWT